MIRYVMSFFSSLNKNAHPGDISHAVSLGFLLAVMPKNNLFWAIIFVFVFCIRINKGALSLSLVTLSFIAPSMDETIERLGFWALNLDFMHPIYVVMDQMPFFGLTKFYNTMVMGGFVFGLAMYIPVYILTFIIVVQYRKIFKAHADETGKSGMSQLIYKVPLLRHLTKITNIADLFKR